MQHGCEAIDRYLLLGESKDAISGSSPAREFKFTNSYLTTKDVTNNTTPLAPLTAAEVGFAATNHHRRLVPPSIKLQTRKRLTIGSCAQ
jgi:hypothetical protein